MRYEMRAEYADDAPPGAPESRPKLWHMTVHDGAEALCGLDLEPAAAVQSADAWGTAAGQPFCHTCGALYLREVP